MKLFTGIIVIVMLSASPAPGQSSSIGRRAAGQQNARRKTEMNLRGIVQRQGNPTLEKHSLIAVKIKPPRKYVVNDLITIIIREQRKYESDAEIETKKRFDVKSTLDAFVKPLNGQIAATAFSNGNPNIDYKFKGRLKYEADKDREDRFTTRVTAKIVDIKPNGNLVLEARARLQFENEISYVTLTGVCRSQDVSPDNTVLSTQLADKDITVHNDGLVRDGTRRGWIPRLLDWLRPI